MKRESIERGVGRLGALLFAMALGAAGVGLAAIGCGSQGGPSSAGAYSGSATGGHGQTSGAASGSKGGGVGSGGGGSGDQVGNGGAPGGGGAGTTSGSGGGGSGTGGGPGGGSPGGGGTGVDGSPGNGSGVDGGGSVGDVGGGGGGSGSCLDGITDYEDAGPFQFMMTAAGSVKIWVPMVPAGCKVPVIHLANGTTAVCADYQNDLERFASHGFLTTCYEDSNTGAGTDGITAFSTALQMYPQLADNKLGSTGHSQGGQAAFVTLQLAEAKWGPSFTYAGLAMEPASGFGTQPAGGTWQQIYGKIKSPMFMFSGTSDMLVSAAWVGQAYSAMNPMNEVYWWSATGATHIPTPQVPEEQVGIPWFRWKLLGDNAACKFFKAIPGNSMINPGWTKQMTENEKPCL